MPSSSPTLSAPPPPLSSSNPKKSKKMQYGDVVVAYISPQNMSTLILVPGGILQNKFGAFHHDAMVNMEFGSKIPSSSNSSSAGASSGFIHALRLTPELWTLSLPHRTQILYSVDISFVSIQLGLMNGTRMIEAGTGSGSFSHSIARSVAPNGHLFTFEYHQQRAEQAKKEFLLHGLLCKSQHQQALDLMSASIGNSSSSTATASNANEDILLNTLKHRLESTPSDYHGVISSFHRDVCKDGFGLEEKDTKGISAVFLDMPSPWEAIPHVRAATDVNLPVNICCFSPCIEQVHQTITALEEHGFTAIRMFEVLSKSYEVREVTMFDMGEAISKRDKRNFAQARNNKSKREQQADSTNNNDNTNNTNNNDNTTTTVVTGVKRKADDHEAEEENEENETTNPSTSAQEGSTLKSGLHTATTVTISKPATTMRGHTSYLTFAVLFPSSSSKTE